MWGLGLGLLQFVQGHRVQYSVFLFKDCFVYGLGVFMGLGFWWHLGVWGI